MATLINGATWGTWAGRTRSVYLNGTVSRSGNTVTLSSLTLYFTIAIGAGWGTTTEPVDIRTEGCSGTSISYTTVNWAFSGTVSNTVSLNNASLSVSASTTSATLYLTAPGGDCASFTISFPAGYTAPEKPTISVAVMSPTSVDITYGTASFGNPSTGTVTLYGGTSASPTTAINSKNTTGDSTFSYTGLTKGTKYYFRARANNGQLDSSYSVELPAIPYSDRVLYGSVSDESKKIVKLYGSTSGVAGVTGEIRSGGAGNIAAFDGEVFWGKARTKLNSFNVSYLKINYSNGFLGWVFKMDVYFSDGTTEQTLVNALAQQKPLAPYGITVVDNKTPGNDYIDLATFTGLVSTEITKLYGSVNGQTKRIF